MTANLATWCRDYAQAVCERADRCGIGWGLDCVRSTRESCDVDAAAALAGSLEFDVPAATACLRAALLTPGCHSFLCPVYLPKARLGERCVLGGCAEGYCSDDERESGTLACPICKPYRALGEGCVSAPGDLAWCDPASGYCAPASDGGSHCVPLLAAGELCSLDGHCQGGACTDHRLLDGGRRRCGPLAQGSACNDGSQCGPFAYCKGLRGALGRTTNHGACEPRLPLGAACTNEQFDDGCSDGGSCLGNVCARTAQVPPGGVCDDWRQCQQGGCTRRDSYLRDGGPNLADGECVSGRLAGDTCGAAAECAVGLYCDGAWCRVPLPAGAPCSPGEVCRTGQCTAQGDGGNACADEVEPGQRCETAPCGGGYLCLPNAAGELTCGKQPTGSVCGAPRECDGARCGRDDAGVKLCAASCF